MSSNDELLQTLLYACAQHDRAALERLYRIASPQLFTLCRYMLRDQEQAENALRETFVQVWRQAAQYDPQRSLVLTWLAVIAREQCLARLQNNPADDPLDETIVLEPLPETGSPLELSAPWSSRHALGAGLKKLPEEQRLSITLIFYRGFNYPQLGVYMAKPVSIVKNWIRRGFGQLQQHLQP